MISAKTGSGQTPETSNHSGVLCSPLQAMTCTSSPPSSSQRRYPLRRAPCSRPLIQNISQRGVDLHTGLWYRLTRRRFGCSMVREAIQVFSLLPRCSLRMFLAE